MEVTFKQIVEFKNAADHYLENNSEETKLKLAIEGLLEQLESPIDLYNRKLKKIQRKHALEGKDMSILRETNGNYKYSKDGEEKLEDDIDELLNHEAEFDIDPEFVEVPADLHRSYVKKFKGFVIAPDVKAAAVLSKAETIIKTVNEK